MAISLLSCKLTKKDDIILSFDNQQEDTQGLNYILKRRRNPSLRAKVSRKVKRIKDEAIIIGKLDQDSRLIFNFEALLNHPDFLSDVMTIRYDTFLQKNTTDMNAMKKVVPNESLRDQLFGRKILFQDGFIHDVRLFVANGTHISLEVERLEIPFVKSTENNKCQLEIPSSLRDKKFSFILKSGNDRIDLGDVQEIDFSALNFSRADLHPWELCIRINETDSIIEKKVLYLGEPTMFDLVTKERTFKLEGYRAVNDNFEFQFDTPFSSREIQEIKEIRVTHLDYNAEWLQIDYDEDFEFPLLYLFDANNRFIVLEQTSNGYAIPEFVTAYSQGENYKSVFDLYLQNNGTFYRLLKENVTETSRFGDLVSVSKTSPVVSDKFIRIQAKKSHDLSLRFQTQQALQRAQYGFKTQLLAFEDTEQGYLVTGFVSSEFVRTLELQKLVMISRNTLVYSEHAFDIQVSYHVVKERYEFSAMIAPQADFSPIYQDLFIRGTVSDDQVLIKLDGTSQAVRTYVSSQVFSHERDVLVKDIDEYGEEVDVSYLMFPYITINNNLAFEFRKRKYFETQANQKLELQVVNQLKAENLLTATRIQQKNIWVIFEKDAQGGHDNGFHFFKYVYEQHPEITAYYVIEKASADYKNLEPYSDKVLPFMSREYFEMVAQAKLLISSDTKYHVYNTNRRQAPFAQLLADKPLIYLQHGVNGLKQVPAFHKHRGLLQFIMAPTQYEKDQINVNQWGYEPNEVAVTGFARWDSYEDKTATIPFKQVFVMPTWRKWMDGMTREMFKATPFYEQYQAFLNSDQLKSALKTNHVRIAFFLHPYFKDYVDLFDIDETIIDRYGYLDKDMGEAMMESSLMITDYSSVAWDQFYLNKPVIFYQFDQAEYLRTEKAYMDYEKELFGDVTFDAQSTVDKIIAYMMENFTMKPEYNYMRQQYFTYIDHHNSERIFKVVKKYSSKT